jgi:hypothetical protein
MAIVSFDEPAARIGQRGARRIDAIASYYVWLVFLNSFLLRTIEESIDSGYALVTAALVVALPLRLLFAHQPAATVRASEQRNVVRT